MPTRLSVLALAAFSLSATAPPAVTSSAFIYESAPYPECHASTIAQVHTGGLVAAWFGGTKERAPDVCIYVARHEGGRWLEPVKVADGLQADGSRLPTWNPVLFQAPKGGPLYLFYKVGPNPREWWGMVTASNDLGKTWRTPTRLPDGILGPIKNKPVVLADGSWLSPSSTEADGQHVADSLRAVARCRRDVDEDRAGGQHLDPLRRDSAQRAVPQGRRAPGALPHPPGRGGADVVARRRHDLERAGGHGAAEPELGHRRGHARRRPAADRLQPRRAPSRRRQAAATAGRSTWPSQPTGCTGRGC